METGPGREDSYLAAGSGIGNNGWRHQKNVINIYLLRGPMMGRKLTLFPTASIPFWRPAFFVYLAEGKMHSLGSSGEKNPMKPLHHRSL